MGSFRNLDDIKDIARQAASLPRVEPQRSGQGRQGHRLPPASNVSRRPSWNCPAKAAAGDSACAIWPSERFRSVPSMSLRLDCQHRRKRLDHRVHSPSDCIGETAQRRLMLMVERRTSAAREHPLPCREEKNEPRILPKAFGEENGDIFVQ